MLRAPLKKSVELDKSEFRLRGLDNTRIEALSDGVFALAVALLIISSSIPENFDDLLKFIDGFIPFAATISLLMLIWYEHYIFFVRYGLKDAGAVAINTVLLFLILFYVYPLKFLFGVLYQLFYAIFTNSKARFDRLFTEVLRQDQADDLMVIYGLGAASIFITMAGLYFYAYRKKEKLELDKLERFDTRTSIYSNLLMAGIPICSALFAFFEMAGRHTFTFAGMLYWLYMFVMPVFGAIRRKKRVALTT
ncbi:MAG: TMEM175 family protein [Bacteroidota bacterium]